jgi:CRISPR-associated protein Cmr3
VFKYLIHIEPLGLLYGSAGRFLSPENLVGRSGMSFPPSSATVSGMFAAAKKWSDVSKGRDFCIAGPFWAKCDAPQNFYVPTPFHCLVEDDNVTEVMQWEKSCELPYENVEKPMPWDDGVWAVDDRDKGLRLPKNEKFQKGTWMAIGDWEKLQNKELPTVKKEPWKSLPHLHPKLQDDQRRVTTDLENGSLFLENAVQMEPGTCLVYLASEPIEPGWYRFGGEGHMVEVRWTEIEENGTLDTLLKASVGSQFALITPAVWGSNRLSYRHPQTLKKGDAQRHELKVEDSDLAVEWDVVTMLTERPQAYRYRLGDQKDQKPGQPKRLSRGRYAVSAGTVYVMEKALPSWEKWTEEWFPREGPSLKRWGLGLALRI